MARKSKIQSGRLALPLKGPEETTYTVAQCSASAAQRGAQLYGLATPFIDLNDDNDGSHSSQLVSSTNLLPLSRERATRESHPRDDEQNSNATKIQLQMRNTYHCELSAAQQHPPTG